MDNRRHVEQIEVIEHSVTEGRRPVSTEALSYYPATEIRTTSENIVTTNASGAPFDDKRYHFTGERDFSREPSFLHQSAAGLRDLPLTHSTPEKNTDGINNYGYDVHEVHTSEGGARIIQSHGSGFVDASPIQNSSLVMHDRSLDTTVHNQSGAKAKGANVSATHSEQLHSILKSAEDWRKHDESSLTRKDSYKKMQENQLETSLYAPSSNATMITRGSKDKKWSFGGAAQKGANKGCWSAIRTGFNQLISDVRGGEYNRKSICSMIMFLLCLFLLVLILYLIFNSIFTSYSVRTLLLYPPACPECLKKNPSMGSYRPPSKVFVHFSSPAQAHFEIVGNPPLKSNSFTAVDFDTGYVAIADHALTNRHGRHTTCFLMDLDRNALPSMNVLQDGLEDSYYEAKSQFGWQEYWQFTPELIDESRVLPKFTDAIDDCKNVQWYYLKHTVYTKDEKCEDCYDFCLPDYAVLRRQKYEDDMTIGIRRLNCFRLYVPDWNRFQIKTDDSGGHWEYPLPPQQTARDADGNWVNWSPTAYLQRSE